MGRHAADPSYYVGARGRLDSRAVAVRRERSPEKIIRIGRRPDGNYNNHIIIITIIRTSDKSIHFVLSYRRVTDLIDGGSTGPSVTDSPPRLGGGFN